MDIIWYLLMLVVTGLIVGALGRLAVPGRDPMSIGMTILVGVVGSFIGGLVGRLLFGDGAGGLILAVAGAALIVFILRKVGERGTRRSRVV